MSNTEYDTIITSYKEAIEAKVKEAIDLLGDKDFESCINLLDLDNGSSYAERIHNYISLSIRSDEDPLNKIQDYLKARVPGSVDNVLEYPND